jgi:DNA-binding NarL/FixJ family response regulator
MKEKYRILIVENHALLRAGLQAAIRAVLAGKIYLSADVSGAIIERYLAGEQPRGVTRLAQDLTHRERQILKLIAEGHRNKYMAEYFSLSIKTVEKHRSNLM